MGKHDWRFMQATPRFAIWAQRSCARNGAQHAQHIHLSCVAAQQLCLQSGARDASMIVVGACVARQVVTHFASCDQRAPFVGRPQDFVGRVVLAAMAASPGLAQPASAETSRPSPCMAANPWFLALQGMGEPEVRAGWAALLEIPREEEAAASDGEEDGADGACDACAASEEQGGAIVPATDAVQSLAEIDYGKGSLSAFGKLLAEVQQQTNRPGIGKGDVYMIAQQAIDSQMIQSDRAAAEAAGVEPHAYRTSADELAELTILADRMSRFHLERGLVQSLPAVDLLLYLDISCFDETLLAFSVLDSGVTIAPDGSPVAISDATRSGSLAAPAQSVASVAVFSRDKHKTKMLQTQSSVCVLVRVGCQLRIFESSSLDWLQVVERTTGDVIRHALELSDGRSPHSEEFRTRVRIATADKAASNDRAEQGLLSRRPPGWQALRVYCHVHMTATAHTRCFALVDDVISGAVNYSLSLSVGSEMKAFRSALRSIIAKKLVVLRGSPSAAADLYRRQVLDAFASSRARYRQRVLVLLTFCNGDWRNRQRVEHYVGPEVGDFDEAAIKEGSSCGLCRRPRSEHLSSTSVAWRRASMCRHRPLGLHPWPRKHGHPGMVGRLRRCGGIKLDCQSGGRGLARPNWRSTCSAPVVGEAPVALVYSADADTGAADGPAAAARANAENRRKAGDFVLSGNIRFVPVLFKVCQPLAALLQRY